MNLVDNDFLQENCLFKVIQRCVDEVFKTASSSSHSQENCPENDSQSLQTFGSRSFQPSNELHMLQSCRNNELSESPTQKALAEC